MDTAEYIGILEAERSFIGIMGGILLGLYILFVVLTLLGLTRARTGKEKLWHFIIITLFAIIIGTMNVIGISDLSYDIENEAFIVYEGEFEFSHDYRDDYSVSFTYSGADYSLSTDDYFFEDGVYRGRVIFSERSKIVLEIIIE
ncbi:MAG: hypothetical protein IJY24_01100 [Clostridia bacterium]|nr:hypothetical protein [Clostridia bacterium]